MLYFPPLIFFIKVQKNICHDIVVLLCQADVNYCAKIRFVLRY